jgi:hypothetical protein
LDGRRSIEEHAATAVPLRSAIIFGERSADRLPDGVFVLLPDGTEPRIWY